MPVSRNQLEQSASADPSANGMPPLPNLTGEDRKPWKLLLLSLFMMIIGVYIVILADEVGSWHIALIVLGCTTIGVAVIAAEIATRQRSRWANRRQDHSLYQQNGK